MGLTKSKDYILPGRIATGLGNLALKVTDFMPRSIVDFVIEKHRNYQVFDGSTVDESQGLSSNKWAAMKMPLELTGKSVLDIGCAEGYFCLESSRRGAETVIGIDSRFNVLLAAKCICRKYRLPVVYILGVFPDLELNRKFNYVFCLSVLHHLFSTKDIWKIITGDSYRAELQNLLVYFKRLKELTSDDGKCIIEIPYEYEDDESRKSVDFEKLCGVIRNAGFLKVQCMGTWDTANQNRLKKDRVIYIAEMARI